jgi:endonuclease/exonuclease/phosphatase family metal-dependent hydrolase
VAKHLGDPRSRRMPGRRLSPGQRWLGWTYLGALTVTLVTVATVLHGIQQRSPRVAADELLPAAANQSSSSSSQRDPGHLSRESNRAKPGLYRVLPGKKLALRPVVIAARRMARTPTVFRVSTFNLLGASHTGGGGNHHGYATGSRRMVNAVALLREYDVDVVGFQEMEPVQYNAFMALTGHAWGAYPGPTLDAGSIRQSIAWRLDDWTLVKADSIAIPYFHGQQIRMPVVLLRNRASGEDVWFANFHNPATTPQHGNNQFWRTVGEGREIALVQQLEATTDDPVVLTGDMNERAEYFSRLAGGTDMCPANALVTAPGVCSMPGHMDVDWIFGSPEIGFSDYVSNQDAFVRRTTDHPIVVATGRMAPAISRR